MKRCGQSQCSISTAIVGLHRGAHPSCPCNSTNAYQYQWQCQCHGAFFDVGHPEHVTCMTCHIVESSNVAHFNDRLNFFTRCNHTISLKNFKLSWLNAYGTWYRTFVNNFSVMKFHLKLKNGDVRKLGLNLVECLLTWRTQRNLRKSNKNIYQIL